MLEHASWTLLGVVMKSISTRATNSCSSLIRALCFRAKIEE